MRVHEHERLRVHAQRTRAAWLVAVVVGMLLALGLVCAPTSWAAGGTTLIVAPHPDDDLLYGAGVVATALANGDSVKVVYMTNGDPDGVAQGLTREGEAVNGQAVLGTPESDLIFLGYPTDFLLTLWESYLAPADRLVADNGLSATYGEHGLGGMDYHTYRFGSPAAYNRPNVLTDLEAILATYRPDDIYTTSEFDQHPDHEATNDFVRQALLDRMAADPTYHPSLYQTIVWSSDPDNWPLPTDPTTPMTEPPGLASTDLTWSQRQSLAVPADMQSVDPSVNRKMRAIDQHASQGGMSGFLGQFVHSDEIFWPETLSLPDSDIAPLATATASSQNQSTSQTADKAIDGVVERLPR